MQQADDAGRDVEPVWLGPKGLRWWMDWSVKRWVLFGLSSACSGVLFAFALPSVAVVAAVGVWAGRSAGRALRPDAPRRWTLVVAGSVTSLFAMADPHGLLRPLPLLLAPFLAVGTGAVLVRLYGRLLDWNRPIGYYARMPRLVAAGPRLAPERTLNPTRLALPAREGDLDRRDLEPVRTITTAQRQVETMIGQARKITSISVPTDRPWIETTAAPLADRLLVDPARPKAPRIVHRVPGGLQVGRTIIQFTPGRLQ
jgi:hypothetical protein